MSAVREWGNLLAHRLELRYTVAIVMSERDLRRAVIDLLELGHWTWEYCPDSRIMQGHPGKPDILAIHALFGLAWIELKITRGRTSRGQDHWHELLHRHGQRVYLWRPEHLDNGTIRRVLIEGRAA